MARNQQKPPKESRSRTLGGWKHPLAAVLLLLAIGWAVGTFFATTDNDFPKVGEVPGLFGLGAWNYAIAAAIAFVAMTIADRTRPEPPPREPGQLATAGPRRSWWPAASSACCGSSRSTS